MRSVPHDLVVDLSMRHPIQFAAMDVPLTVAPARIDPDIAKAVTPATAQVSAVRSGSGGKGLVGPLGGASAICVHHLDSISDSLKTLGEPKDACLDLVGGLGDRGGVDDRGVWLC